MKVMHFESNLPGTVIDIFHSLKFCDWGIKADSGAGAMNSLRDHHAGALRDPLKFSFPRSSYWQAPACQTAGAERIYVHSRWGRESGSSTWAQMLHVQL